MAKIQVEGDSVAIRTSWIERIMLGERSRMLPLATIRAVNPHPPLMDLMVHWADQSGVWLGGVAPYEGHLIPSSKNPEQTLAIDVGLEGEEEERLFVELDEGAAQEVALLIDDARRSSTPPPPGAKHEPEERNSVPMRLDNDHDLVRIGGWMVGLGSLAMLIGATTTIAGVIPGVLAVGAGMVFAILGGVALAVVASHPQ